LFVNDIYDYLYNDSTEYVNVDNIKLFSLLFADDTALFSYSATGLQRLLDRLHEYCSEWGISVNTSKTVVMVFNKGNRIKNIDVKYNDIKLEVVNKFTYLGVTLSSNGNFLKAQEALSKQASRALFSLNKLFSKISFSIADKIRLFDAMILPILTYGTEIWGFHPSPDIEKVHLKFLKQTLSIRPQTTSAAVYGELGRFPLECIKKMRIIKFWFNIKQKPDSLLNKLLLDFDDVNRILLTGVLNSRYCSRI
jgi:hypothetical protein